MTARDDDWGPSFGEDDKPPVVRERPRKTGTSTELVYLFREAMPVDKWGSFNTAVNGPALMKAFKTLKENGRTHDDIKKLINMFAVDIKSKPLASSVPPWKAFLGRLSELESRLDNSADTVRDFDDEIDPRLKRNDG